MTRARFEANQRMGLTSPTVLVDTDSLYSAAQDRAAMQLERDAAWEAIRLARKRLDLALECHPIENAGMRELHIREALNHLRGIGEE